MTAPVHGAPCWVSLAAHDLAAAQRFYGRVLGWDFRTTALGEEFSVASYDGVPVAGLGAIARSMGVRVEWTPFFAVRSADVAASRISERSATVAVGPIRMGGGRTALAADQAGATFGFWEGEVMRSWDVQHADPPARLELRTRDAFDAAIFYGQVFDWATPGGECEVDYQYDSVIVRVSGRPVATLRGGAVDALHAQKASPQVRPRWDVSFHVDDVDAAAETAVAAGGRVLEEPAEAPLGRRAALCDPEGGLFTVTAGTTAAAQD